MRRDQSSGKAESTLLEKFIAGGVGGFACWLFSYP